AWQRIAAVPNDGVRQPRRRPTAARAQLPVAPTGTCRRAAVIDSRQHRLRLAGCPGDRRGAARYAAAAGACADWAAGSWRRPHLRPGIVPASSRLQRGPQFGRWRRTVAPALHAQRCGPIVSWSDPRRLCPQQVVNGMLDQSGGDELEHVCKHPPRPEHLDDPQDCACKSRLARLGCAVPQACRNTRRRMSDGMQAQGLEPDATPAKFGRVVNDDAACIWRYANALDAAQRRKPPLELAEEGVIATSLRHLEARAPRQAMNKMELVPGKHSPAS